MRGKSCFFIGILLVFAISFACATITYNPATDGNNSIANRLYINIDSSSDLGGSFGKLYTGWCSYTGVIDFSSCILDTDTVATKSLQANVVSDGVYYFYATDEDNLANLNWPPAEIRFITIDTTGPTTTDNAGTFAGTQTGSVTVSLNCADAGVGCDTTLYCISNTGTCPPDTAGTSVIIPATDGTYYITYQSNDTLGNVESSATTTSGISIAIPAPAVVQQRSSGGGGGKPAVCPEADWSCTEFGSCINGIQTRTCTIPSGHCTSKLKPTETQTCTLTTIPVTTTEAAPAPKTGINAITGAVTGALGTTGSIVLIIVIIVAVGIAYWLVRKNKIKKKDVTNKVKWKGKKD